MLTTISQHNALVNLFHQGTRLTYKKGEFIIRPGESPSGIFYLASGLVKAYDITRYGEENLLIIRKKGEIIGLTCAITGRDRDIIYAALAPTELFKISRELFKDFIRDNPKAALPLVDMLADMYCLHTERILNLEYRSVRERIISFLLTTSKRFGKPSKHGILLDVPLRHQDIASSVSATRETASRELAVLERQGLITRDKHSMITLRDINKLQSYLE
ncbi:MAG TPA: Crp/Fnr family transcriptional regulator [Candidatus Saccharimonadales bacterium]